MSLSTIRRATGFGPECFRTNNYINQTKGVHIMAFQLSNSTIPTLSTYQAAIRLYEEAKPWRGYDDGKRKLVAHSSKHNWSVRRIGDAVAFRYHNTDVIVWHGEHKFECTPWGSISTTVFANSYAPSGVYMQMTCGQGPAARCSTGRGYVGDVWHEGTSRIYIMDGSTIFEREGDDAPWQATSGFKQIDKPVIDQRKARAALRARGFYALRDWLPAALAIRSPSKAVQHYFRESDAPDRLAWIASQIGSTRWGARDCTLDALGNRELWTAFLSAPGLWPETPRYSCWGRKLGYSHQRHIAAILQTVRACIYLVDDVVSIEKLDYADSFEQLRSLAKMEALYS